MISAFNAHGIHTTEIIREEYGKDKKRINLAEMGESIIRSFNRTSINYSLISSLSYIVNLFISVVCIPWALRTFIDSTRKDLPFSFVSLRSKAASFVSILLKEKLL